MRKIFLDVKIVIDYLDASSRDHFTAVDCLRIIRKHFGKPVVSPITFIADFLIGKFVKNEQWHKNKMPLAFSAFEIADLKPSFIENIFKTHFIDLDDGLPHQCALHAKAFVIVTKDINDHFDSKIPVAHPIDFVVRYKNTLGK
jgi:hypothetical protein